MGGELPADVFLNDAPLGAHLVVDIIESGQLLLLPAGLVDAGVFEVHPSLPNLDFGALEALASHLLGDLLPFFRAQLRIEDSQQFNFLGEWRVTYSLQCAFLFLSINKYNRIHIILRKQAD